MPGRDNVMQPASSALPSEAGVRPTRPLDLQAMARCNPRDDALVVHDKCVPRARQCTTLEKGPSRLIVHDSAAMAYSYRERPVGQPKQVSSF